MKFFIDFEATRFTGEIISIGCVSEHGETFSTLVTPQRGGKINSFITNLTGITEEDMENALTPSEAFDRMYDWIFSLTYNPEFFAWGDGDVAFIRHTFPSLLNMRGKIIAGLIAGGLVNYSKVFSKKSKIKDCSLIQAYNLIYKGAIEPKHEALYDATILKKIFSFVENMHPAQVKNLLNPSTNQPKDKRDEDMNLPVGSVCILKKKKPHKIFKDMEEAIDWVLANKIPENQKDEVSRENIQKRIEQAYCGKLYFGYRWGEY